jgi:uncharacterized protein
VKPEEYFAQLDEMPNHRSARFDDLEVSEWSEGFRFEGHAAVFGEEADLGGFTESVERGAFRKVLQSDENIPMLYEHNVGLPLLACTRSGTLKLDEDAKGLAVVADVANTSLGRDLRELAARGDISGMSYGFVSGRENSKLEFRTVDGVRKPHRTINNFKRLLDVSPTWDPVFASAEGQFRSLAMMYVDSPADLQQLFLGANPQLGEQGMVMSADLDSEAEDDDKPEARSESAAGEVEEQEPPAGVESGGRAIALAARKRRLSVMSLTLRERS